MTTPYIMRKGVSELDDLSNGYLANSASVGAKSVYYVEGNAGNDSNTGLSWAEAFKTLAVALAASHADIASGSTGWASQNVIYLKADATTETLVALAQKTTVIGVGTCDGNGNARVIGAHTISGTYAGCHFVNVDFLGVAGATTIFTLPTGAAGIEFHGCRFMSGSTTNVAAISTTSVGNIKIHDCEFYDEWVAGRKFTTAAINIGTGAAHRTDIARNLFALSQEGHAVEVNAGHSGRNCWIRDNYIHSAAMAIDENSNTVQVVGNRIVVGVNAAAETSVDISDLLSLNNQVTGGDGNTIYIPGWN